MVLLIITSVEDPELNVFVLFLFTAFLFFFVSIKNVYKDINVRLLESATLPAELDCLEYWNTVQVGIY